MQNAIVLRVGALLMIEMYIKDAEHSRRGRVFVVEGINEPVTMIPSPLASLQASID